MERNQTESSGPLDEAAPYTSLYLKRALYDGGDPHEFGDYRRPLPARYTLMMRCGREEPGTVSEPGSRTWKAADVSDRSREGRRHAGLSSTLVWVQQRKIVLRLQAT